MTETTTQPDPQVVARVMVPAGMSIEWEPQIHRMLRRGIARMESQRNPDGSDTVTIRNVEAPARKPLTVADIPAGQGTASLFLMRSEQWGGGFPVLFYRDEDGRPRPIYQPGVGGYPEGVEALWEHLAATLPTIDTTEESLR